MLEIDPCERDPVATEEVAQVLHVSRVPPTDEIDVTLAVGGQLDHARLQSLVGQRPGQGVSTTLPGMCLLDLAMKASRASASG